MELLRTYTAASSSTRPRRAPSMVGEAPPYMGPRIGRAALFCAEYSCAARWSLSVCVPAPPASCVVYFPPHLSTHYALDAKNDTNPQPDGTLVVGWADSYGIRHATSSGLVHKVLAAAPVPAKRGPSKPDGHSCRQPAFSQVIEVRRQHPIPHRRPWSSSRTA
eukprot:scaffold3382_cov58-Phaeocystis_antarctica.AAC.9